MSHIEAEIEEIVNRETRAWETRDVKLLLTVFHPDMVWPWPPDARAHDPINWVFWAGRYDYERWSRNWQQLFDTHQLVHNRREIKKIVVTTEGDGAFAVVDVDTLWQDAAGRDFRWLGRACKVYAKVGGEWKMTMHTGLLDYGSVKSEQIQRPERA
ncbi:MAG: YybH family protein [Pyrinomonadaceae bacterium]